VPTRDRFNKLTRRTRTRRRAVWRPNALSQPSKRVKIIVKSWISYVRNRTRDCVRSSFARYARHASQKPYLRLALPRSELFLVVVMSNTVQSSFFGCANNTAFHARVAERIAERLSPTCAERVVLVHEDSTLLWCRFESAWGCEKCYRVTPADVSRAVLAFWSNDPTSWNALRNAHETITTTTSCDILCFVLLVVYGLQSETTVSFRRTRDGARHRRVRSGPVFRLNREKQQYTCRIPAWNVLAWRIIIIYDRIELKTFYTKRTMQTITGVTITIVW